MIVDLLMLGADVGDRDHADRPQVEGDEGSHRLAAAALRLFALGDRAVPVRVEDATLAKAQVILQVLADLGVVGGLGHVRGWVKG